MPESENNASNSKEIDKDLVRKVADQVYKLMLQDAQLDYERRRFHRNSRRQFGGH